MLESSFRNLVAAKHLPEPLVAQLRRFTTSLIERGYADCTVRQKLQLLTNFGQWLGRNNFAVTRLDEQLVEAFLKRKRRVHRGVGMLALCRRRHNRHTFASRMVMNGVD